MSKSLGNVIDPVEVIEGRSLDDLIAKLGQGNLPASEVATAERGMRENFPDGIPECGTDALRFALVSYTIQTRDINLDVSRVHGHRQFCNKIWQIARFCAGLVDRTFPAGSSFTASRSFRPTTRRDRWILHRLSVAVKTVDAAMTGFTFSDVPNSLYEFWYNDLADVYLEAVKFLFRFADAKDATREARDVIETLYVCLDTGFRLLHPLMPFLTEELWQRLAGHRAEDKPESLVVAPYPRDWRAFWDETAKSEMSLVLDTVREIRATLSKYKAGAISSKITVELLVSGDAERAVFEADGARDVAILAKLAACRILDRGVVPGKDTVVQVVNGQVSVAIRLGDMIDPAAEKDRLERETAKVSKELGELERRVALPDYLAKARPDVVARDQQRLADLRGQLATLKADLERVEGWAKEA